MKSLPNKLLQGRTTRWGFLAVLLIAAGATVAGMNHKRYQLGGGWIGSRADGFLWNCLQIPTDPAGKSGILHVAALNWGPGYAEVVAALGGNAASDGVGELRMISNDTAKWTMMAYEQNSTTHQVTAIEVYSGTFKFTSPDTAELNYSVRIYPAAADANHDGYPDEGVLPALTIPGLFDTAKRVPIE